MALIDSRSNFRYATCRRERARRLSSFVARESRMKSSLSPLAVALAAALWSGFAVSSNVSQSLVAQALRDAGTTVARQDDVGTGHERKPGMKRDTGGGAK
ncbi:hypothetical protein, partial [Tahibacter soli]